MTPRAAFADQAASCRALGSELTARVLDHLGRALQCDQGAVARRVLDWPGDPCSRADSLPLRMAGALHALVLSGADAELAQAYASGDPSAELLLAVIARHGDHFLDWLESPPQTNEVGRSAALIAAARVLGGLTTQPLHLMELGASAGLNLNFPLYHLAPQHGPEADTGTDDDEAVILRPAWRGQVPQDTFAVQEAEGVDLRPIDPLTQGERLLAYCWADQPQRLARLRGALRLAASHPPRVTAGDAADWLEDRLSRPAAGCCRVVFHTVAWQYFPPATQARCTAALAAAAARASEVAPLAHLSMEADGGKGAALTLRFWNGTARHWHLARVDFHGRWIDWQPRMTSA